VYHPGTLKGIGDDAAVLQESGDKVVLVSTDMLLEGVHFDLAYTPLAHLGYKAMAVNFSDIAAMNAQPKQVTVSIGLSNRFSVEAVEELYKGIHTACEKYQVDLVGGDTTSSRSGLVISVTVIGYAKPSQVVYRSGAKVGDVVCVSGDLGAAYLGLQLLEREKQAFLSAPGMQPELDEYSYLIGRQLKPEARTDMVHDLREKGVVPHAMIDISDGLASEIMHICRQSNVSAVLYEEKLPIDDLAMRVAGAEFKLPAATCAMNGGEDYELLFTVSQEDFAKIEYLPDVTPIGYIREAGQPVVLVTKAGQVVEVKAQGWNHF
jgi:thiamine-monophosphate kinase